MKAFHKIYLVHMVPPVAKAVKNRVIT